jgi:hypothetical protein
VNRVRLYSTKSLKPLGLLEYHKGSCQALAFAHSVPELAREEGDDGELDSEDELGADERAARGRWLASGGKDARVAVWPLMSFGGGTGGMP